jgi:hypothetical protein
VAVVGQQNISRVSRFPYLRLSQQKLPIENFGGMKKSNRTDHVARRTSFEKSKKEDISSIIIRPDPIVHDY